MKCEFKKFSTEAKLNALEKNAKSRALKNCFELIWLRKITTLDKASKLERFSLRLLKKV